MYIEKSFPLIRFQDSFGEAITPHGWTPLAKYKVMAPAVAGQTRKVIDVRLYRSIGTDGQRRNMGVATSWGGKPRTAFGQETIVSYISNLGLLTRDQTDTTKYLFPIGPVLKEFVKVYVGDVEQDPLTYTVSEDPAYIKFNTAPNVNATVRATFGLSDDAAERPNCVRVFTFEDVLFERYVMNENLTVTTGNTYALSSVAVDKTIAIKTNAIEILKNGTEVIDPSKYTIADWGKVRTITFSEAQTGTLTASYVKLVEHDGANYGTFACEDFAVTSGQAVIQKIYESFRFVGPSFPTTLTFIDALNEAWGIDCELFYWGNITKDRMVMFFRLDPSPDPVKCYYAPLYFGKITTLGKAPKLNTVVIGGSSSATAVPSASKITVRGKDLNYGPSVSNGNDGVQLMQTIGGSSFQIHRLAFTTHDVDADISPESRYNPSAYTGKYHISPMYVVHPDDGYVGILDEVYAVHPRNISQMDELEVKEKATNEFLGEGDGVKTTFHLRHTPKEGTKPIVKVDCVATTDFTIVGTSTPGDGDEQVKAIKFNTAPAAGKLVYADYDYEQVYGFTLATTPECPFLKDTISPFSPIGIGILKKNGLA